MPPFSRSRLGTLAFAALLILVTAEAPAQSAPGSAGAKKASKCQQVVSKANGKFLAARLKRLATCSTGVLACVQTAAGEEKCLIKASAKCQKLLGTAEAPTDFADTLEAAIRKACDPLPVADLLDPSGLGFANAAAACGDLGVPALTNAADVAQCLRLAHTRASEQTFGVELPRAAELVAQGGVAGAQVSDLPLFGGCGGCATGAPAGKAVTACSAAIAKASAGFVASTRTALDKCSSAFVKCAQEKAGDPACLTKAAATCRKLPVGLAKARLKLHGALQKKCGALGFDVLENPSGLGLGALTCACQQVGVEPVLGLDDYAACLARQHECELAALLPTVVPGLDGLLAAQGIALGELLCEPATAVAPAPPLASARSGARIFKPPFGGINKFMKNVFPASLRSSRSPLSTRGTAPRVGAPTSGKCAPGPGKSCSFRLPISKRPANLQRAGGRAGEPPALIVSVRRPDGEFVDDYFEVRLGDTSNDSEVEIQVEYADDLASCQFELALSVAEEGEVASYTAIEQQPHLPPVNDACGSARPIESNSFFEVLDATAATSGEDPGPSCNAGGFSRGVWYSFTPTTNGVLLISTVGSSYDTMIAVYDGCDGPELACGNDPASPQDTLQQSVLAGVTYWIQVGNSGDPTPPTATLQLSTAFVPLAIGSPATISKLVLGTPVVDSPFCFNGVAGTAFPLSFDYSDPTGIVTPGMAAPLVMTHYEPSQREEFAIPASPPVITGNGFTGDVSYVVCGYFGTDTIISFKVKLATFGGLSNELVGALPKPPGAD